MRLIPGSARADDFYRADHVSLPTISPLRGLVEVTRLLRAREDLPALLDAVARTIGESLGYRTVAVNLYRPAWDDFEVTTVYGNEGARAMLLGNTLPGEDWTVLLAERFERRGAYVVPRGSVDWDSLGPSYVPAGGARVAIPTPGIPRTRSSSRCATSGDSCSGSSRSTSRSAAGGRPTTSSTCSSRSSTTRRSPSRRMREAADSARHQRALEELLAVSSRITGETSHAEILRRVCTGIRDALDFQQRLRGARRPGDRRARAARDRRLAARGAAAARARHRRPDRAAARRDVPARGLLPPHPRAGARRGSRSEVEVYPSQLNGRGPWAWNRHWLIVPLQDGQRRAARDHLGRQPVRPARAVGRPPPGAADLRERRRRRARLGPASRRAAVPRRPRPAHAPPQPARLRHPPRGRGRAGACATAAPSASWSPISTASSSSTTASAMPPATRRSSRSRTCSRSRCGSRTTRSASAATSSRCSLAEATEDDARQVVARVEDAARRAWRPTGSRGPPTSARASAARPCPEDADDAQTLFRLADEALYDAKRNGTVLRFVARA